LTQLYPSTFVGLLLPIGSAITRTLAIFVIVRSFHMFYWEPKQAFLAQLPPSAQIQANVVPPLLGDIEASYSYLVAFVALIIGNVASAAALVQAMLTPDSMAWLLSFALSSILEVLDRAGLMHRVEVSIAARLEAKIGLSWPTHLATTNALELVYLRSLGGTGYVAPTMALCIGCLRAVTFGDPGAIVWVDVSQTVWRMLVAQLAFGFLADAIIWSVVKKRLQHVDLSARFGADHPLSVTDFRDFDLKGYIFAFCMGGAFIYAVFVAFLGPAFVTGMCRDFDPNATAVWVRRALDCVNAPAVAVAG
jgi:hypothetical protein